MLNLLKLVRNAFDRWKSVREHPEAQRFLLSLLATKRSAARETRRLGLSGQADPTPKG